MSTSEIIKKAHKGPDRPLKFSNIKPLTGNISAAEANGRRYILKKARDNSIASLAMLRREYEISSPLQHPYILSPFMFDENTPVGPAIVMEYVEGRTLDVFICERPDINSRRKLLAEILEAVDYLHTKGLLHNDIKSENILVTHIGNHAKIIDFGLAENEADYLNRRLGGTKGASAPEVMSGDTACASDASSDIYAVGGIISTLFPKRYRSIVRKCRKPKQQDRFQSINELKQAIRLSDRLPVISAAAVVIILLGCMIFIPEIASQRASYKAMSDRQMVLDSICADLESIYKNATDSILNPDICPSRESAMPIISGWVAQYVAYKQSHHGWENEIDSIYTQHYYGIINAVNSLPFSYETEERETAR